MKIIELLLLLVPFCISTAISKAETTTETETGKHGYTIAKNFVKNHPDRFNLDDPSRSIYLSIVRVNDGKVSCVGEVYLNKGKVELKKIKIQKPKK